MEALDTSSQKRHMVRYPKDLEAIVQKQVNLLSSVKFRSGNVFIKNFIIKVRHGLILTKNGVVGDLL
jgi:protein associated with RNAse G/E